MDEPPGAGREPPTTYGCNANPLQVRGGTNRAGCGLAFCKELAKISRHGRKRKAGRGAAQPCGARSLNGHGA